MDPVTALALAGNVEQFSELAFKLVKMLYRYCKDVINAAEQAGKLHQEISIMIGVMASLKVTLETRCDRFSVVQEDPLRQAITGSIRILEKLLDRMEGRSGAQRERNKSNFLWPFQKKEIDDALKEIDTHKMTLCLALQIEHVYHLSMALF
jgi:hypothetical protein